MKNYVVALSILLFASGIMGCGEQEHKEHKMMPGMEIETEAPEQQAMEATEIPEQQTIYTCPMHPEVQSDKPGKCPKCGMNLEIKK